MHWSSVPRLRRLKQNSQQKQVKFFQEFSSRIFEVQQTFLVKGLEQRVITTKMEDIMFR